MTTPLMPRELVCAADDERDALAQIAELVDRTSPGELQVTGADGTAVPLPNSAARLLSDVARSLARGKAVSVILHGEELTTQQAADILNVSRPYLIRILERGEMPYTTIGTHRRIRFDDLMAYKHRRDAKREEGLRKLAQLSQEAGLYDAPASSLSKPH